MPQTFPQEPARILVVDDDDLVCYHYRHLLSRDGHQVQVTENAEQAFCLLEQHVFDLILLDLRMPGMGGMEFLRKLRQRKNAPEVLMVSGFATTEDAVEAARLGVANVIQKPCRPEKRLEQVCLLLDRHRNPLVAYIRANFATIISREMLADIFHIAPKTVSNRVQKVTGRSFRDFLYSCRIREARRLLVETDQEAKEIAARVGFRSYHTFSRAFRRLVGHTPHHYRKEIRSTKVEK